MKDEILKVSQSSVAQALAADYFCIYYVNTDNDKFILYSASSEYEALGLAKSGDDFVAFSRVTFDSLVYPDDRELFLETFTKKNVLSSLREHRTFTMTFRLLFGNMPTYVHLKATQMKAHAHHIVIGISSVDDQMKTREAYEKAHHSSLTFSRIAQALAEDYFSIYYVDLDTDHYIEYKSSEMYKALGVSTSGDDFFGETHANVREIIDPRDQDRFLAVFTKERLSAELERCGIFTIKYRLLFDGVPTYVSLKATLLHDSDGRHMVIGINNIDAQMQREKKYQENLAAAQNKAKNDFLANMSHDIRTPMNAIIGYTNIANSHLDDPEAIRNALEKIGSSSHFLLSLINDILDMSKIESGKMQLSVGSCNLEDTFRRIEDITALQAGSKSLQISYDHEGIKHYHVRGDELRIEQVLINIVSNAIKYTPEGREVYLLAEEEPLPEPGINRYRFVVRDTGIGISEEYLPYIFESFTREKKTTINRIQGTGLGLAITAKIVELMGGTISVRSTPGEGSEFTVILDLEEDKETASATCGGDDLKDGPATSGYDPNPASASSADAERDVLAGKHILLVEDNDINAEIARMILEQYGMKVSRAENGEAGLQMVRGMGNGTGEDCYDAVLMDIQMPVMDGYEATRAIRALGSEYAKSLPILAMSANAFDEDVRNSLEAGMNTHIAKPFNPEELLEKLRKFLK